MVGARRASIMVFDETAGVLRTVAARGFALDGLAPVRVDDDCSVAARVYRERRVVAYDPAIPDVVATDCGEPRGYRGQAFLSVPICYGAPGSPLRCVGVINLTDRLGGDRFTLERPQARHRRRQPDRRRGGECATGRARPAAAARPLRARAGARPPAQAAPVAGGAAGRRGRGRPMLSRRFGGRRLLYVQPARAADGWA